MKYIKYFEDFEENTKIPYWSIPIITLDIFVNALKKIGMDDNAINIWKKRYKINGFEEYTHKNIFIYDNRSLKVYNDILGGWNWSINEPIEFKKITPVERRCYGKSFVKKYVYMGEILPEDYELNSIKYNL